MTNDDKLATTPKPIEANVPVTVAGNAVSCQAADNPVLLKALQLAISYDWVPPFAKNQDPTERK